MSEGLKVALILGAAGVAAFLIFRSNTTSPVLGAAPGAPTPPAPNATATNGQTMQPATAAGGTSSTSSGGSSSSTLKKVALLAAAPVVVPTELTIKAGEYIGRGAVGAAKTIGSAASSVVSGIASIF